MIFYLENGDKFHLYTTETDVIFVHFSDAVIKPLLTSTRWFGKNMFINEHMKKIIEFLKSNRQSDRNIGKAILEQTLKVNIHGTVIGWDERGSPL